MSRNMQKIYRAALALNNMGVSLLAHHRYQAALDTFKDSISTINLALRLQTDQSEDAGLRQDSSPNHKIHLENELLLCVGEVDVKLQQAAERTAGSTSIARSPSASNNSQEMTRDPLNVDFVILSDSEHTPFQTHHSSSQCAQKEQALALLAVSRQENEAEAVVRTFLVRIDPIDHQTVEDRDMEVDIGIFLYNYGISCKVLADSLELNGFDHIGHLRSCSRNVRLAAYNTILLKLMENAPCAMTSVPDPTRILPLLVQSLNCKPAVVSLLLFQVKEVVGVTPPGSQSAGPATHQDEEAELNFWSSGFTWFLAQRDTSPAPAA